MEHLIRNIGIGFITATVLLSAKSQTLTINKAIELALKHSPDVDMSRFDFKRAIERSKFQQGYYLPTLDLSATAGRQGMEFKGQDNMTGTTLLGTLSASQLLYDFGKTSGRISAADEEAKAYEASMNQFISNKILSIKTRYYDVLKVKSFIKVNKENITLQEGQLRRAQRYYESGIKTIIDVSDAKVRLTQAQLELNNSKYDLKLRRAILEQTMGYVPYNGKYTLSHRKLDLPNVSHTLPRVDTGLPQLEGFAYGHRYELQSSKYLAESSKYLVASEEGGYLPTLVLTGDYTTQDVDDDFIASSPEQQWQAGVVLQWNLFSGNQTDASVQEAKISTLRAASNVDDVRLLIKRQVIESSLGVQRTKDAVTLSESIAKASKQKFIQAQKRYENDLSDYIELQEAQQGYITSLADLVNTYYDYYIALASLDYSVGR
ncbi:TolC family protein [Sulfurovum sp.]|uniref:TolC family protein n=1 Tax=Sulfurovum sp. TaxID=1969726 RepID=UPI002867DF0E|nr:TolC family protein [Sulfurovum sp.]